jgi:transposase-like protein
LAQNFLLSARYRDLPVRKIACLSDAEAYEIFLQARWKDGVPKCPECDSEAWTLGDHSRPGDKRQFRCKSNPCRKKFSVTSGTLLHSRKKDFVTILMAIRLFISGAKGISSIQLGADGEMAIKTAWVLAHKMREAQIKNQLGRQLSGIVEIDGSTYGGYYHQVNEKSERIDRRKLGNITGKEMSVVVARERSTKDRVGLSVCTVVPHEADSRPFIVDSVDRFAKVYADDGSHWDALAAAFDIDQVNHSQRYYDKGICTNQAESYFSRVDRMEMGTHHHIAGDYLWGYACDAVWREDKRRDTQRERFQSILIGLLGNPVSRTMKGYWQRHLEITSEEPDLEATLLIEDENLADDEAEGMSQKDIIALFGRDALPAQRRQPGGKQWKARKPFAPRKHDIRPKPWSELQQPRGLPSFIP